MLYELNNIPADYNYDVESSLPPYERLYLLRARVNAMEEKLDREHKTEQWYLQNSK